VDITKRNPPSSRPGARQPSTATPSAVTSAVSQMSSNKSGGGLRSQMNQLTSDLRSMSTVSPVTSGEEHTPPSMSPISPRQKMSIDSQIQQSETRGTAAQSHRSPNATKSKSPEPKREKRQPPNLRSFVKALRGTGHTVDSHAPINGPTSSRTNWGASALSFKATIVKKKKKDPNAITETPKFMTNRYCNPLRVFGVCGVIIVLMVIIVPSSLALLRKK
jgi:hypothetical protein